MSGVLRVDGQVRKPMECRFEGLTAFPEEDQVRDVSRFHPKRFGDAVTLDALLREAGVEDGANYVTLHAEKDDFHVSVPLALLLGQGLVVYSRDGKPLGPEDHGPFRLLIKDPTACQTGELDDCANVKYLSRIELASRKGRDTRPTTEAAHEALHAAEKGGSGRG